MITKGDRRGRAGPGPRSRFSAEVPAARGGGGPVSPPRAGLLSWTCQQRSRFTSARHGGAGAGPLDRGSGPGQPVNGSRMWLKSHVFCVMPEQVLLSTVPGQPPLSRWIAQIDKKFMLLAGAWAKLSIVVA